MRATSSSCRSRARPCGSTPALWQSSRAIRGPTPYKYCSEMTVGLSLGMSTPSKRGICRRLPKVIYTKRVKVRFRGGGPAAGSRCHGSTLALFVARVALADHIDHAAAANDLALPTDAFDAGANFH